VVRGSPSWPPELDEIEAAPPELWLRGRTALLARAPRIAIVGTRAPTPYGEAQARRFAQALASAGVPIVSGLARGIDQAAHAGALDCGGATLAVLACGVDRPWPAGELTDRVAREGLVLSEFPPGVAPRRHHFPLRNRLISGLARGVVVIEAAYASGSLITARWAADQGRTVWALPGRVDHPMARGCHRLLREGASLIEEPAEILAELGLASECALGSAATDRSRAGAPANALARDLLTALRGETLGADELAERLGRDTGEVLTALVGLELEGAVVRGPGGLYRLA